MIRVCVVDDHPALRAGLWTVIRSEPGMEFAGSATRRDEALELVKRVRPDVVLVDYQLPGEDGLLVCERLKLLAHPPRILVYSAYSNPGLAITAILAGADGIASKAALANELLDSIRLIARGRSAMPPIPRALVEGSEAKLESEDKPIFAMLMNGVRFSKVAETMGLTEEELRTRSRAMLGRLRAETPQPASVPDW